MIPSSAERSEALICMTGDSGLGSRGLGRAALPRARRVLNSRLLRPFVQSKNQHGTSFVSLVFIPASSHLCPTRVPSLESRTPKLLSPGSLQHLKRRTVQVYIRGELL